MSYRIEYSVEAYRDTRVIPAHLRKPIRELIASLADNPHLPRSKELRGLPGVYRVRLEQWRIMYRPDDEDQAILIIRIKRKTGPETYEGLAEEHP